VSETLRYDVTDAVATVTLNRPEALNALDTELKVALRDTLAAAAVDPDVRAVVLTGEGRAFCVGQDLREHSAALGADVDQAWQTVPEHYIPIATLLATMDKPVVAAVNGVAAGAGAALAFASDFRVVAEAASFNLAFAGIGLSCDTGVSWTLPRLVGMARAKELLMLGGSVGAAEALAWGLATSVEAPDRLLPAALELAGRLAAGPTRAYGAIRRALAFSAGHEFDASLLHEGELMAMAGHTQDHRDAVAAFARKEKPAFRGR
jgi:2-(1,2-epoxy-1,2-dihydrophenyl)acetyl-CoA isomerase